ncbi:hypothetical protein N7532_003384 [Penicillium argentinense]|uniref:Uncharacterized protein n=1 Tax=Penicillium argentinense TaxID=1131581 RepID=A0A9W9KDV0_9EURO|nr:uncharacterized protein N7532_003384 [Penicillium argentinense]KAJ5102855.1 hypothetical protein N7532_003384 [Penicillium argentinense]
MIAGYAPLTIPGTKAAAKGRAFRAFNNSLHRLLHLLHPAPSLHAPSISSKPSPVAELRFLRRPFRPPGLPLFGFGRTTRTRPLQAQPASNPPSKVPSSLGDTHSNSPFRSSLRALILRRAPMIMPMAIVFGGQ